MILRCLYQHIDIQKPLRTQCDSQSAQHDPQSAQCVGHVDFMLFVSISFEFGRQHECRFWWNMGFRLVGARNRCKQTKDHSVFLNTYIIRIQKYLKDIKVNCLTTQYYHTNAHFGDCPLYLHYVVVHQSKPEIKLFMGISF